MREKLSTAEMIAQRAILEIFRREGIKISFPRRTFNLKRKIKDESLAISMYGISSGDNPIKVEENTSTFEAKEFKEFIMKYPGNFSLQYVIIRKLNTVKAYYLSSRQLKMIEDEF